MLLVSVAAHETEAEPASIRTSELRLIVIEERMTKDTMLARVEAEAAGRGIERVAWIQERWIAEPRPFPDAADIKGFN